MTIYQKSKRNCKLYRKIYENHYGPIPIDEYGRTYHIHHIDGNHSNNDISNLMAISIQEHFNIHYLQKDWGACFLISKSMTIPSEKISEIARHIANNRVNNGTHNFLTRSDGSSLSSDRVKYGTHHLLKRNDGTSITSDRSKNGTHPFLNKNKTDSHPLYDHTIYKFENLKTKEICITTQHNLRKTHNLNSGNLSEMINGHRKSCGGWRLFK